MRQKLMIIATVFALTATMLPVSAAQAAATNGDGDVQWLELVNGGPSDAGPVDGATASIHRSGSGVTLNIHTNSLDGVGVYSLWAFIFNCGNTTDCGPNVVGLGGHVVGASGVGNFAARIPVTEGGLTDPSGAELHVVMADHGPVDGSTLPGEFSNPKPPPFWDQVAIFAP